MVNSGTRCDIVNSKIVTLEISNSNSYSVFGSEHCKCTSQMIIRTAHMNIFQFKDNKILTRYKQDVILFLCIINKLQYIHNCQSAQNTYLTIYTLTCPHM